MIFWNDSVFITYLGVVKLYFQIVKIERKLSETYKINYQFI